MEAVNKKIQNSRFRIKNEKCKVRNVNLLFPVACYRVALSVIPHLMRNPVFRFCILQYVFILLLSTSALSSDKSEWQWIGAERIQDMLKEGSGLWLIDVRSERAYEAEHIEGSVNISSASLACKKFPINKTLILVDDSIGQKMAREAAEELVKKGYERVYVLEGGIVSWELGGYPVVVNKSLIRGVTTSELKWAISNKIPLKIFDMRDTSEIEKGRIQNSEPVSGKDIHERVEKLKGLLKKGESKDLSNKLEKTQPVILVFSASEDAAGYIQEILRNTKSDVRYLIGGYEALIAKEVKQKVTGDCPTCPGKIR